MRYLNEIQLQEVIVHILDSHKPQLDVSDYALPFAGNPDLVDYFTGHIRVSLQDSLAKAARFENIRPGQASGICTDILAGRASLVDGSRQLAVLLYHIMAANKSISPADLALCIYVDPQVTATHYLALLKIDPSKVFQNEIITDQQGKKRITFNLTSDAFTQEKLQKAALIRPNESRSYDYDMLLLDRQSGKKADSEIAKFFAGGFLETINAYDETARTKLLYSVLKQAHEQISTSLPENLNLELSQRIRTAVNNRSINTDRWTQDLPVREGFEFIGTYFREQLALSLADIEFDLDPKVAALMTKRLNFEGDYEMKFSVLADHYNDVVKSATPFTTPEGETRTRVIIETRRWKEIV